MNVNTEIDIYAAEGYGEKYDAACKRLFGNKEILAPILKYTVREYKNSTVDDIMKFKQENPGPMQSCGDELQGNLISPENPAY